MDTETTTFLLMVLSGSAVLGTLPKLVAVVVVVTVADGPCPLLVKLGLRKTLVLSVIESVKLFELRFEAGCRLPVVEPPTPLPSNLRCSLSPTMDAVRLEEAAEATKVGSSNR